MTMQRVLLCLAFATLPLVARAQQPPLTDYIYEIPDQSVGYSPATGEGQFSLFAEVTELPTSPGFPNVCDGFAMGLGHDPAVVTLSEVQPGTELSLLNGGTGPDFWAPTVLSNGFTLGCVFSFMTTAGVVFDTPTPIVRLYYETNPAPLMGNPTGVTTQLFWTNALSRAPGGPTVTNALTVVAFTRFPELRDGTLTLQPTGFDFRRGDCNGDANFNLTDAVVLLGFLFPNTPPSPPLACEDSCDANDDGSLNLSDAIALLGALFGFPPVPLVEPTNACGPDPTNFDPLSCKVAPLCP